MGSSTRSARCPGASSPGSGFYRARSPRGFSATLAAASTCSPARARRAPSAPAATRRACCSTARGSSTTYSRPWRIGSTCSRCPNCCVGWRHCGGFSAHYQMRVAGANPAGHGRVSIRHGLPFDRVRKMGAEWHRPRRSPATSGRAGDDPARRRTRPDGPSAPGPAKGRHPWAARAGCR